ncbi:MAG: hypothetical protein ACXVCY_08380 [Pseudobdellovibrionaceae bacterium]
MKAILYKRIKKWMLLAAVGCVAYLVGYFLGQLCTKSIPTVNPLGNLSSPIMKK